MSVDLRQPAFAGSEKERLEQMANYLFQLHGELQWAFNTIETSGASGQAVPNQTVVVQSSGGGGSSSAPTAPTEDEAELTFAAIKMLIIKSADIVKAYSDIIEDNLKDVYLAIDEKDKLLYKSVAEATYTKTAEFSTQMNARKQEIQDIQGVYNPGDVNTPAMIVKENGYVKTGFLGGSEYGIEVGYSKDDKLTGTARFTSSGVTIYDENGVATARASDRRFRAPELEAESKYQIGGFVEEVDPLTKDVTTKWVG